MPKKRSLYIHHASAGKNTQRFAARSSFAIGVPLSLIYTTQLLAGYPRLTNGRAEKREKLYPFLQIEAHVAAAEDSIPGRIPLHSSVPHDLPSCTTSVSGVKLALSS